MRAFRWMEAHKTIPIDPRVRMVGIGFASTHPTLAGIHSTFATKTDTCDYYYHLN